MPPTTFKNHTQKELTILLTTLLNFQWLLALNLDPLLVESLVHASLADVAQLHAHKHKEFLYGVGRDQLDVHLQLGLEVVVPHVRLHQVVVGVALSFQPCELFFQISRGRCDLLGYCLIKGGV